MALSTGAARAGRAQTSQNGHEIQSLNKVSLQQVEIVTKEPEEVLEPPAAICSLAAGYFRRLGAMNIPDLLCLVPCVEVAQISSDPMGQLPA